MLEQKDLEAIAQLIDARTNQIIQKLDEHDKRFDTIEKDIKDLKKMDNTIFNEVERVHEIMLNKTRELEKKII